MPCAAPSRTASSGSSVSFFTLEVTPPDLFTFQLETGAGHNTPSGAAQDRRMWLEFLAYDETARCSTDVSSGNIADDEIEEKPADDPEHDPQPGSCSATASTTREGKPGAHVLGGREVGRATRDGYESSVLPVATTTYIEGKHAVRQAVPRLGPGRRLPARVTARLRMRPIGLDVLQDLVDSGDLDPAIVAEMPTFTFGAQIEWTPDGVMKTIVAESAPADCNKYRCLIDPSAPHCD